jgi:hypothetical protein
MKLIKRIITRIVAGNEAADPNRIPSHSPLIEIAKNKLIAKVKSQIEKIPFLVFIFPIKLFIDSNLNNSAMLEIWV